MSRRKTASVKLSAAEYEALKAKAQQYTGGSISKYIRAALKFFADN